MTRLRAFGSDTFRSLRVRNFRLFFVGQIISQTGTWMQMIAIGLLVLAITDSGVAVGLVTAAQFLPILVLGAWGGVLADRRDRHHLLIAMNVAGAVVAAAFARARAQRPRGALVGVPAHLRGRHRHRPREPRPPGARHRPRRRARRPERRRAQQHADDDVPGVRPGARRRAHRRAGHRLVLRRQRHLLRAAALALPPHGPLEVPAHHAGREGQGPAPRGPALRVGPARAAAAAPPRHRRRHDGVQLRGDPAAVRHPRPRRLRHHLHHDDVDHEPRLGGRRAHHRPAHRGRHRVPRPLHARARRVDGRPSPSRRAPGPPTSPSSRSASPASW